MSDLEDAAKCIGAATTTTSQELRVVYAASARDYLEKARSKIAELDLVLGAVEAEIVRVHSQGPT